MQFKIIVGVVVLTLLFTFHYTALERAREGVRAEYLVAYKEQERKALETQGEIALRSQLETEKKNEEITRLSKYADSLLVSLSHRPTRPEQSSSPAGVESSCTGRELYKEDGEFLVREAARAEQILVERNYYYSQYEQARKQINEFNQPH